MSFRATSSALCKVASCTVEPAINTGSRTAYGVTAPVRPTLTSIRSNRVVACSARNLKAIAHRGNFDVAPSRARWAASNTLTTTPSVSNFSDRRFVAHSSQNANTCSIPSHACQCGSTGKPPPAQTIECGRVACAITGPGVTTHDLVDERAQTAPGHQRRVEGADRAGGRVAGVGKDRLPGLGPRLVDPVEAMPWQEHLAQHLEPAARISFQP